MRVDPPVKLQTREILFDPFAGRGTTQEVATALGRRYIGCELNPAFVALE
jgi:site-specific DNA-methyltransferase (cytosine-N4-specific)